MSMGHLPRWSTQPRATLVPWRRHKGRRWVRPNDLASAPALFAAIPSLPRAELARLTTRMIDRMDEIDGDSDLEHLREDDEDTHDREQEQSHE
jgi:hypothetical protein